MRYAQLLFVIAIAAIVGATMVYKKSRETKSARGLPTELSAYQGTYRGFAPTDGSAARVGEMEIRLGATEATMRVATGSAIQETVLPLADYVRMTEEDYTERFPQGEKLYRVSVGFHNEEKFSSPALIFGSYQEDRGACQVLIVKYPEGDLRAMLGPTILLSPAALSDGEFEEAVAALEDAYWEGVLPTLKNGGRAPHPSRQ